MALPRSLRIAVTLILISPLASEAVFADFCPQGHPPSVDIYPGTNAKLRGPVHPSAVNALRCVAEGLRKQGLPIKTLYGYGCRPKRTSNHPRGLAVDVDQYARDKTNPGVPRQAGIQIARACNAVSGAVWRNPDNGHFEVHSLSRAEQLRRRPANSPQRDLFRPHQPRKHTFLFWTWYS